MRKKIFFVTEIKSTTDEHERRPKAILKIKCGTAHFKEFKNVEYKLVSSVGKLI